MTEVRSLTGEDLLAVIPAVAALRIEVFRDFPYLYDGDMGYEQSYMETFAESPFAIVVGAFDGDRLVGAATGTPMEDHAAEFAAPFGARGYDLGRIFYCAESVLLPHYRGQGIGHRFFDLREAHARDLGRDLSAFCAVIRPEDHPLKPADYQPLDGFWQKRGYKEVEGLKASFLWKDIDADTQTRKSLQFWMRSL